MALPETGLTIDQIRQTLSASTHNLGELCIHPNINMFAKYKPVILPQNFPDRSSGWWKSVNRNCGIKIPMLNRVTDNPNWTYEKPYGGQYSPYRMCDFNKYEHNAYPVLTTMFKESYTVNKLSTSTITLMCLTGAASDTNLGISDILNPQLSELYFGVEIYTDSGVRRAVATADTTLGAGGNYITVKINTLTSGDYKMYFYLSSARQIQGGAEMVAEKYAMYHNSEYINPVPLVITQSSPFQIVCEEISYNLNGIYVTATELENNNQALQTDGDVAFKVRITGAGAYPDVNFRIRSLSWWGTMEDAYLGSSIYDSNKNKVNAIREEGVYYFFTNVFSRKNGSSMMPPAERIRMYAFCEFLLTNGSALSTAGIISFPVVSGVGAIVPNPGSSGDF